MMVMLVRKNFIHIGRQYTNGSDIWQEAKFEYRHLFCALRNI
jgi:hypothetical protein